MNGKKRAEERNEEEDHSQGDRRIEERPLQAAASPRDTGATAENTAAAFALDLDEDDDDERYRNNDLNDVEIRSHSNFPLE